MSDMILSVVTPERSIVSRQAVEAVVLPGSEGQLTLLPGHVNFITAMRHGTFGYKVAGEWQIAFLSSGFAQVFQNQVTVLAETMEMAQEVDIAAAEMLVQDVTNKLKSMKVDSPDYGGLVEQRSFAQAKLKASQKKIH